MSTEAPKRPEEKSGDELEVKRIHLKRHLWPDEVEKLKYQQKIKHLRAAVVVVLVASLLVGWGLGSVFPNQWLMTLKNNISTGLGSSDNKIQTILNIMENDWYFGHEIKDLNTRLVDQAATGITTNAEDTHTEYMSAEETDAFTQSINRSYVGIGVSFTSYNDVFMVNEVFAGSPAGEAGVQSGDIFESVDGKSTEGLSSDELKQLVQGEEGSEVTIVFKRNGTDKTFTIKRAAVSATAYGYSINDHMYYLHLEQFGDGTPNEIKKYLSNIQDNTSLILDLRNNGGGYLDSAVKVASMFLPENTVVLQREYADGHKTEEKTGKGQITSIHNIAILVNANTASAAEVLTMALKEQRSDVTVIGTVTYGKGTVQITKQFDDGSALKYTTSKWLSPKGEWINGKGITPDKEVDLDEALTRKYSGLDENKTYAYDSVGDAVSDAQVILKYLGYGVDRTDGYFDQATTSALTQFQTDHNLSGDGVLKADDYNALLQAVSYDWATSRNHDTQYAEALEALNGSL